MSAASMAILLRLLVDYYYRYYYYTTTVATGREQNRIENWRFRNFSFYPSIAPTGLVRAEDSLETRLDWHTRLFWHSTQYTNKTGLGLKISHLFKSCLYTVYCAKTVEYVIHITAVRGIVCTTVSVFDHQTHPFNAFPLNEI